MKSDWVQAEHGCVDGVVGGRSRKGQDEEGNRDDVAGKVLDGETENTHGVDGSTELGKEAQLRVC